MRAHIAFYRGRKRDNSNATLLDRTICAATGSPYSHVELVCMYSSDYTCGLCWSSSPRDGGVRRKLITFHPDHWDIYRIVSPRSGAGINYWFDRYKGARYDWVGAVATVVPGLREHSSRWFCSEIVGKCLKLPRPHTLTPGTLHEYYSSRGTRVEL